MIKVKLKQLVNSINALETLGEKELDGLLSYKIGKIMQQISNELQLYNKVRHELLEKYCIKDQNDQIMIDNNGNAQIKIDQINNYNNQIRKLEQTEVELNIVLLQIEDFQNIQITPKDIMKINWLIKEKKEET